MRSIKHCEAVEVKDFEDKVLHGFVTLKEFIRGRLNDGAFGKDMDSILAASRIETSTRAMNDDILLEENDWKLLKQATEKPVTPYQPVVARNFVDFMRAITEAKEVKP